jgi:hypothetical protein
MRLLTTIFPSARPMSDYGRLLAVLVASAAEHSPATPLEVVEAAADDSLRSRHAEASELARESFAANTRKMQIWQEAAEALADGEVLCLMDADTMVLRDLSAAEWLDYDVTYTARPRGARFAINSGVVLVRGSERSREFFRRWRAMNELMLDRPRLHEEYRQTWGGINQAALGAMIHDPQGAKVLPLHCVEWNCEDSSWRFHREGLTRIAHIKGRLRRACIDGGEPDADCAELARIWRGYDERGGGR